MTEETPQTDPEATRKAELMAEGERHGLKFDKRYSVKRMEDMLAEKKGETGAPAAPPAEPSIMKHAEVIAAQDGVTMVPNDEFEAMKRRLAELEEAAKQPPAPSVSNRPAGMLTSMDMRQPGDLQKDEDERRILMERAVSLGIGNEIPPRANNDAIREHIMRHVASKATEMQQREEIDRRRAAGPVVEKVSMRVMRRGHDKISRGIHVPGVGDACYQKGDLIHDVPRARAEELELAGMVEIVGG